MDLHGVRQIIRPASLAGLPPFEPGDVMLGGGTYLFSAPQPAARRLIDLDALSLPSLTADAGGLTIAATCRLATLAAAEVGAPAMRLFAPACHALWGSFKVHNAATVGGNLCLALPAAPMAALMVALDGVCLLHAPGGAVREVAGRDFILAPQVTMLRPGEMLAAIRLPATALRREGVLRQASLTRYGRSAAMLIGTRGADGAFALTITAAVRRPLRLDFDHLPSPADLRAAVAEALAAPLLHDDVHGDPLWKRDRAIALAGEIAHRFSR